MDKNDLILHPSTEIVDSSKLQDYANCARGAFFNHVLGWSIEGPNNDLKFGETWHRCQEHLLLNGYTVEAIQQAALIGEEYYRRYFPPVMDKLNEPKIPGILPIALAEYVAQYKSDRFDVLFTEVGGAIPIDERRVLHFRVDSILRDHDRQDRVVSLEHKTSKRRGYFEQYTKNIQSGTYNHVLYCAFPFDDVFGVEINGAVFLKKERDFQRIPARRTAESLMEWVWTVQHWYDRLEWDFAELNECSEGDPVMTAFVKNTQSCNKYGKCKYYDICHARPNPLQLSEPPPGYEVEFWDPRERESKATLNSDGKLVAIEKEEPDEAQTVETSVPAAQNLSPLDRARAKVAEGKATGLI